jgi:Fe-S cluster assembly protein SufD
MVIATGAGTSRADFGSDLLESGASGRLYGLVFGDEEQRFTHHTHQDHRAPHTTSDLLFKAALRDNARSVYTGLIKIAKEAQNTNAYQASKNPSTMARSASSRGRPRLMR